MLLSVLAVLAALGVAIYASIDCAQSAPNDVQVMGRAGWLAAIVLVPVAGPLAWIAFGRPHRARHQRGPWSPAEGRPVGPDDDPDFLHRLREEQRRQRRDRRAQQPPTDSEG